MQGFGQAHAAQPNSIKCHNVRRDDHIDFETVAEVRLVLTEMTRTKSKIDAFLAEGKRRRGQA
jgi:hypothetical protein